MNRSTAAQSQPKKIGWPRILLLAAAVLFGIWFTRAYEEEATEYRRYLSEDCLELRRAAIFRTTMPPRSVTK